MIIVVIKDKKYWEDIHGNKRTADNYTETDAESISKTLVNCYNCIDCSYCEDCKNCTDCKHCVACYDCTSCTYCTGCIERYKESYKNYMD